MQTEEGRGDLQLAVSVMVVEVKVKIAITLPHTSSRLNHHHSLVPSPFSSAPTMSFARPLQTPSKKGDHAVDDKTPRSGSKPAEGGSNASGSVDDISSPHELTAFVSL